MPVRQQSLSSSSVGHGGGGGKSPSPRLGVGGGSGWGASPPVPGPGNAARGYTADGYFPSPPSRSPTAPSQSFHGHEQHQPPILDHPALRKTPSAHSLSSSMRSHDPRFGGPPLPPMPIAAMDTWRSSETRSNPYSDGLLTPGGSIHRSRSTEPFRDKQYQMPSSALMDTSRSAPGTINGGSPGEYSPPGSPTIKEPTRSILAATMKTKVFLKQAHSQWKSLGTAKLSVFVQTPGNLKQLVVEGEKGKVMISTIVVTDGVERVGRTGVAVDLSDEGRRTGIVYMLQMKNETSATALFEQLLQGSDRRSGAPGGR